MQASLSHLIHFRILGYNFSPAVTWRKVLLVLFLLTAFLQSTSLKIWCLLLFHFSYLNELNFPGWDNRRFLTEGWCSCSRILSSAATELNDFFKTWCYCEVTLSLTTNLIWFRGGFCFMPWALPYYTVVGFNTGSGYFSCFWLNLQGIGSRGFSLAPGFTEMWLVGVFFLNLFVWFSLLLKIIQRNNLENFRTKLPLWS